MADDHNQAEHHPGEQSQAPAAPKGDLRQLLEQLLKLIVDHPEEVAVEAEQARGELLLNVRVSPQDVGKVIGRQGRTVRSLRTLIEAAGMKQGTRCAVEIIEDEDENDAAGAEESGNAPQRGNEADRDDARGNAAPQRGNEADADDARGNVAADADGNRRE